MTQIKTHDFQKIGEYKALIEEEECKLHLNDMIANIIVEMGRDGVSEVSDIFREIVTFHTKKITLSNIASCSIAVSTLVLDWVMSTYFPGSECNQSIIDAFNPKYKHHECDCTDTTNIPQRYGHITGTLFDMLIVDALHRDGVDEFDAYVDYYTKAHSSEMFVRALYMLGGVTYTDFAYGSDITSLVVPVGIRQELFDKLLNKYDIAYPNLIDFLIDLFDQKEVSEDGEEIKFSDDAYKNVVKSVVRSRKTEDDILDFIYALNDVDSSLLSDKQSNFIHA